MVQPALSSPSHQPHPPSSAAARRLFSLFRLLFPRLGRSGVAIGLGGLLLLSIALALPPATSRSAAKAGPEAENRRAFYQAAYVLTRLVPNEGWERLAIPPEISRDDEVSVLLHHQDKLFVFLHLARELDSLDRRGMPLAAHFAAHAYRLAGRNREAAEAMRRHIGQAPFKAADRLFLMQRLYEGKRYAAMREEARAWEALDGACREERTDYVWGSYVAQGLYQEARNSALFSTCPGWPPLLLAARARFLLGEEKEALAEVAAVSRRFPADAGRIDDFWRSLEASPYP